MSSASESEPRLCNIVRASGGYGFHLHGEKGKTGHLIKKVEPDSAADQAGLREGDIIIEVNGQNVENETHHQVVARIKEKSNETALLVRGKDADNKVQKENVESSVEVQNDNEIRSHLQKHNVENGESDHLRPRICHLVRGSAGFGFNLHSEKGKQGSFIKSVEEDGPSFTAGLRTGDRIVEINGKNMEFERHSGLVEAIKSSGDSVKMLVVDEETDAYFKSCHVVPTSDHVTGPLPKPADQKSKAKAPAEPDQSTATSDPTPEKSSSETNGNDLPNLDLSTLKQMNRSSKKKAPQSNWNNRQAIFNNL